MMPSAITDAMISGHIGQPAASMICNTSGVLRAGSIKKRDFKPRAPIRQPAGALYRALFSCRAPTGLAKKLSTVFVDNDVHTL
jgi:hypothetical protein